MKILKKKIVAGVYFTLFISIFMYSNIAAAESGSTSFEFRDSGTFSIGEAPFTATFVGGIAQTLGNPAYYHSGLFSWHVPQIGRASCRERV